MLIPLALYAALCQKIRNKSIMENLDIRVCAYFRNLTASDLYTGLDCLKDQGIGLGLFNGLTLAGLNFY